MNTKPCKRCGLTDRWIPGKNRITGRCRPCSKKPKMARQYRLKRLYGITPEQLEIMFKAQNGVCAICSSNFIQPPRVDHSHLTNEVRGLLCHNCNTALGLLQDNPEIVDNAASYLRKYA